MNKTMATIVLYVIYVLGAPFAIVAFGGLFVYECVYCCKHKLGFHTVIDIMRAVLKGAKEGHAINMAGIEIKYGNNQKEEL